MLRANVAACHVKLEEWKEAVDAATESVERLEGLDGENNTAEGKNSGTKGAEEGAKTKAKDKVKDKPRLDPNVSGVVEELSDSEEEEDDKKKTTTTTTNVHPHETKPSQEGESKQQGETDAQDNPTDDPALPLRLSHLHRLSHTATDVRKLRTKALLRRAKARSELGSWVDLQGADDDYRAAAAVPGGLAPLDRKAVDTALRGLPARLEAAKQKEVGEMMGKLKNLGNGLLKPFGLSTDNFAFVKDEKTGGYSMSMK